MTAKDVAGAGIRRRELLGGAALLGAASAIGVARFASGRRPDVIVYDGAHAASAAYGRAARAPYRIDLDKEAAVHWRGLRRLRRGTAVQGLTGWDIYVAARGLLEEQGLRIVSEVVRRQTGLIAWSMA